MTYHQPVDTLKDRTFLGLIIAQFLAGFNDQAIHAAAMFFAIHQGILDEAQAISLMPILFYLPWAIFCTISGYLADRYSKRHALVIWKVAEVVIAVIALGGFFIGAVWHHPLGAWIVMSTVFLMGTHAAFFAPAKYGAMPEILQPHVLSKGNGILESTTFLAAILGTVTGGLLSKAFRGQEYYIGVVLLILALIGAGASLMIRYLPAANPQRLFPTSLGNFYFPRNLIKVFQPLWANLKVLFRSRPLALAVLGIAFFIFMVAFMRSTMYMHGQTRNPIWDEFKTSLVVATVALGVGLGSPLAGYLSGGKVELGLVPLGCLGMILGTLFAAFAINSTTFLVAGLIVIGFFSGFYMVPLYTLLQHRAPKTSKGDLVATSNFINVLGAIAASLLFFIMVQAGRFFGVTPEVDQIDRFAVGPLQEDIKKNKKDGFPEEITVLTKDGKKTFKTEKLKETDRLPESPEPEQFEDDWSYVEALFAFGEELERHKSIIEFPEHAFQVLGGLKKGDEVVVSYYKQRGIDHYRIRQADKPLQPAYDNEALPRYLFFGAALMTLGILFLLVRKLPDFFVRTLFWFRSLGRYRLKVVGMHNLPTNGPVILATNCNHFDSSLQVLAATDRHTHFILVEDPSRIEAAPWLRYLAGKAGFTMVPAGQNTDMWDIALMRANQALKQQDLLAVTVDGLEPAGEVDRFLDRLPRATTPIVPVYCGPIVVEGQPVDSSRIRVVFGHPVPATASGAGIRQSIRLLGDWIRQVEADGTLPLTHMIPGKSEVHH